MICLIPHQDISLANNMQTEFWSQTWSNRSWCKLNHLSLLHHNNSELGYSSLGVTFVVNTNNNSMMSLSSMEKVLNNYTSFAYKENGLGLGASYGIVKYRLRTHTHINVFIHCTQYNHNHTHIRLDSNNNVNIK